MSLHQPNPIIHKGMMPGAGYREGSAKNIFAPMDCAA